LLLFYEIFRLDNGEYIMPANIEGAQECIRRCNQLRREGRSEAVLRNEFTSWLRSIFPDAEDLSWINHYSEGTEAATRIRRADGTTANRFMDNLVRATTIEYEANLQQRPRFETGYHQVKEHVAGALNAGTPISQVRGILSDTVEWHVYDVTIPEGVSPETCTPDNITLTEVEVLRLSRADRSTAQRFISFLQKHLARQQSRQLTAEFITTDLGLDSSAYGRHVQALISLVNEGRNSNDSVALVTDLWSQFVDSLERTGREFRASAYVDEAYIAILARLLCANILEQRAIMSEDDEMTQILSGEYFENRFHLSNFIEQDYFGWLWRLQPYLGQVLQVAHEVQRDLYAYDFSQRPEEDLFGRLMAQLARKVQRRLLGQEWTPQWMSRHLAVKCVDMIPNNEVPRLVDMCCGSGSILSEAIKHAKEEYTDISFTELSEVVTGFDIDPLAVLLAKTTWVVTLADEIRASAELVTIPVYHADSLFAVTPVSRQIPLPGDSGEIIIELDGNRVDLPAELIRPENRQLFDGIIDWSYDEAREAQQAGNADALTQDRATTLVDSLIDRHQLDIDDNLRQRINECVFNLARRMAELAVINRNGIWAGTTDLIPNQYHRCRSIPMPPVKVYHFIQINQEKLFI